MLVRSSDLVVKTGQIEAFIEHLWSTSHRFLEVLSRNAAMLAEKPFSAALEETVAPNSEEFPRRLVSAVVTSS